MNPSALDSPSFLRRLGAMFYDGLLIGISSFLLVGIVGTILSKVLGIPEIPAGSLLAKMLFLLGLGIAFFLFGWFWTHGGQTLGLRAWKLRVVDNDGRPLDWQKAFMRYAWSLLSWLALGTGFWIAIFDPEKLTWHDRLSRTRIIKAER
ncbi:RDD family protein [Thiolinea disciformis]|uniref:RDD family protein n=1 Tax=Thiolinea disciformis TaxID=125614 RepID=UPI0003813C7A|nr:RDD family protein [Thiolinea disciformis]